MIGRLVCTSLVLLAGSFSTRAEWKLNSTEEISSTAGVRCVQTTAADEQTGDQAKLTLALCDTSKTKVRVLDRPNGESSNLAQVMEEENCIAGVNGGYFDPDYAPVGLLISDGKTLAPLRRARLLSGVLSVVNGRVGLQRVAEFSPKTKASQAIQCGPFLVDRGTSVHGLENSRTARRTFAATGGGNRFILGVSSAVSLAQLSRILVAGRVAGDTKIDRALNLDGGSSTAFWCKRAEGTAFSISEQKPVRDFVAMTR